MNWIQRYRKVLHMAGTERLKVLSGFNANIDRVYHVEKIPLDFEQSEPDNLESVNNAEQLKSLLHYCIKNGINKEVDAEDYHPMFKGGKNFIGGQGGIISDFLANIDHESILYTPIISKELTKVLDRRVKTPVVENGEVVLKSVKESINSTKTKINTIFEFEGKETGRLILSDRLEGFKPVFKQEIMPFLEKLDRKLDRIILSGFNHFQTEKDVEKVAEQFEMLQTPIHVEYAYTDSEITRKIAEKVCPYIQSLGCDEDELKHLISSISNVKISEKELDVNTTLGYVKHIVEEFNVPRVHVHTDSFHLTVLDPEYPISDKKVQEAMLFGELSAIKSAEKGRIPMLKDYQKLSMDDKHLKGVEELEEFEKGFGKKGITSQKDLRIVAIPILIHENPKRLVGMGDIISSGSFTAELLDYSQ